MAEAITVARPYAEAVYKLAVASDTLAEWSSTLKLAAEIAENERVKFLIGNPLVSIKQLRDLIFELGGRKFNNEAHNFINLMVENRRVQILLQVSQLYEDFKARHEGVLEARIVSAFKLDSSQLEKLVRELEHKFKRKIEANVIVDSALIGGVKIEIGDEIIDASVHGKLEAMAIALKS
ncbi:MAG: F0F1 ATP synthase subunit delta [Nitrosomonas sp.]|nr:MAG: F0F1 ATP synthase subunit delta [Nitrosomonas sp.]